MSESSGAREPGLLRGAHIGAPLPTGTFVAFLVAVRTYPSLKIWVAGCSTGEEAYALAIVLREEGLLKRTLIYATDINPQTLQKAAAGVYAVDRIVGFTENHRKAGGRASLSDYYTAAYGRAVFDKSFQQHIVFADHSLATDSVFAEVHLVSCRNVLIYLIVSFRIEQWGYSATRCAARGFSASA